jgi:hypothetical protein
MPKYYTPKEANETLITIRPMVEEMMKIAGKIQKHQPDLWNIAQKAAGNGGSVTLSKLLPDFDRLHNLIHQVQELGIEIKDLTIGLIDFVCSKDGREIYLCWKYNEVSIQFWHEIEAGFQGRQKIDWE